jgi:branched-chain amino acid transport system substrate-binding protein
MMRECPQYKIGEVGLKHGVLSAVATLAFGVLQCHAADGNKNYGPGVTDTEIKIGQTVPYSGPVSSSAALGKGQIAYFDMVNKKGGIKGRKINIISLDDGYSPPKTVEQTRKLVEQEEVLAIIGANGTPTGLAVQKYLNAKGVPQLLQASGMSRFDAPKQFPWTTAFFFPFKLEGALYAKYVLEKLPNAKIAIISPNDDVGKEYLAGFRAGLGEKADAMIVKALTYETTEPTADSQIATLMASGADLFFNVSMGKFVPLTIRKSRELNPSMTMIVPSISTSVGSSLRPAGLDNAKGLISGLWRKEPTAAMFANDADVKDYLAFMKEYLPGVDPDNTTYQLGIAVAQITEVILRNCGDDLTRENLLKQATTLKNLQLPMTLPGVQLSNDPEDYNLLRQIMLARFDGQQWVPFTDVLSVK